MLKRYARALSIALMITVILVPTFIVFVSSSTGYIRVNSKTASAPNPTVQAGGTVNLYFGEVTWSGSQVYLLMSLNSNPQASTGDVFYTPAILVNDVNDTTTTHQYSNGMGSWVVGHNWINGSIAPNIPVGAYTIKAFDSLGAGTAVTDVFITVNMEVGQATLQVAPFYGPGGIAVTITGSGYGAYSTVTLSYYDSYVGSWNFLGTTSATGTGQITFNTEVPDLRKAQGGGDHPETYAQVSFRAEVGGIVYSYADYNQYSRGIKQVSNQVASGLFGNGTDLSTEVTVEPNNQITISGKWFHPGVVYIRWDSTGIVGTVTSSQWETALVIGNTVADQTGSFSTTISIPSVSAGEHYIAIEDSEARVTVRISLQRGSLIISPPSGPGGIEATFTGSGYPASSTVTVEYYDTTFSYWNFLGTTTANGAGQITFTSEILDLRKTLRAGDCPDSKNMLSYRTQVNGLIFSYADYYQYARGIKRVDGQIASGLYGNGTDLSSKVTVEPGDEIIISGEWFHPGVVYVRWDGKEVVGTVTSSEWAQAVIMATSVVTQTGHFELNAIIPPADEGIHYISIEDSESFVIMKLFLENEQSSQTGYELNVASSPLSRVVFKIDGSSEATPYNEKLEPGTHVVEMPESQVVNGTNCVFQRWSDGNQDRIRTVNLQANVNLNAVFLTGPVAMFTYSSTPAVGEEITFDASASFDLDGTIVSYLWDFDDGTQFTTATPVTTHSYDSPDTYQVQLTVTDNMDQTSEVTKQVPVKITTSISISTSSSSTSIGFQVQISGSLVDINGAGLADKTVVLEYAFEGTSTWTPFTSDQTDSNGVYSRVWIPPATGYFTIKAEWEGSATHLGASNITTINSIDYDGEYVFSVESNSTITALTFNSTENSLSFNAQGDTGTKGYAKIIIAKTLVANPQDMIVLLDGNQIEYTLEETTDSWALIINYAHSTHKITVALGTEVIPEFPSTILLALVVVASTAVAVIYRKKLTKN